jgi:Flp pilus assembly secretin CpaC
LVSLFLLTTSILSGAAPSQSSEADKEKIVRQVAQRWIQVGAEQYKRGYFKAAKQSFLRAQDYQEYLTADEREKLNAILEKTHEGILAREYILEAIRMADGLVKEGKSKEAKAKLEEIKDNEFLIDAERELIAKGIKKLDDQLDEQKKAATEIYNQSVELYKAGELEKAREGFVKIAANDLVEAPAGETAEDYLLKIDDVLAQKAEPAAATEAQPEDELGATIASITKELVNGKKAEPNEPKEVAEQEVVQEPVEQQEAQEPVAQQEAQEPVEQQEAQEPVEQQEAQEPVEQQEAQEPVEQQEAQEPVAQQEAQEPVEQQEAQEPVAQQEAQEPVVQQEAQEPVAQQEAQEPSGLEVAAAPEREAPEPVASGRSYLELINRKRSIRQSHTSAVVNDAVAKVQDYVSRDEFDKAKEEVEKAERIVNEYQPDLGEELFKQYSGELKQLAETIDKEQDNRTQQLQEQKRLDAIEAQRRYREQMEADRKKRIAELMDNAIAFQSQQRYDEALGQLESLLALDRSNDKALLLKQTLTDMIDFRKQLEVQRESDKERVNTLVETDEAMIPYAKELTHPKDWRDIIASPFRKPDEPFGRSAAEALVDKQLDEIVDLSQLTPQTPFGEAIELLKHSVDPPLQMFVVWRDLYDNADVDQTTPINMDPISGVPLKNALGLLLEAVSGGFVNINYLNEGGIIKIATAESLPPVMNPLVYDITDLIGRPADFYAQSGGTVTTGGAGEVGTAPLGEQEQVGREQLLADALARANSIVQLIEQTVSPLSWVAAGGEASITVYESKKLIIYQTPEAHKQIDELLGRLRQALGNQVAIEARFLLVGENFLEDVGLDVDIRWDVGGKVGLLNFQQSSSDFTLPSDTGITGSWGPTVNPPTGSGPGINALNATGVVGNLFLNPLQVDMLLRATQAHRDAKALTAPKVTVLNGEMAAFRVQRIRLYPYDTTINLETLGQPPDQATYYSIDTTEGTIVTGTLLNITPIITPDKKNVLLNIETQLTDFLGFQDYEVTLPVAGFGAGGSYTVQYPEVEMSRVQTRVSVPDKATLLLGGQRITADVEREAGVPVLSKVPFLGRLFSNRSKIKDSHILLILVKPTIILREEAENKAIAAMESNL